VTANETRTRDTEEALLRAARELLRSSGYAKVTVAQIVRRARRAHGTFYLYFENKEAIYSALLEQMWLDLRDQGRQMWHADTPMESVRVTVHRFLTAYQENLDLWELAEDIAATNATFRVRRVEHRRFLVERIRRGIEGSLEYGNVEGLDIPILAEIFAGILHEVARTNFRDREDWPIDVLVDNISIVWARAAGYAPPSLHAGPNVSSASRIRRSRSKSGL
jgi:AcrR family transcriptional regulator